jgi:hypothetical protein
MKTAHLVLVADTVATIHNSDKFRERKDGAHNELSGIVLATKLGSMDEVSSSGTVESKAVEFVKEIKGAGSHRWISKNESQRDLLASES